MSRPTKLTKQLIKQMVNLARKGHYKQTICEALGIDRQCWYNWQQRGEAGEEPFALWLAEISQARAEAEHEAAERLRKIGMGMPTVETRITERAGGEGTDKITTRIERTVYDSRALEVWLRAMYPARWANRLKVKVEELDALIARELARLAGGAQSGVLPTTFEETQSGQGEHMAGIVAAAQREDWEKLPSEFSTDVGVSPKFDAVSPAVRGPGQRQKRGGKSRSAKKNTCRS